MTIPRNTSMDSSLGAGAVTAVASGAAAGAVAAGVDVDGGGFKLRARIIGQARKSKPKMTPKMTPMMAKMAEMAESAVAADSKGACRIPQPIH